MRLTVLGGFGGWPAAGAACSGYLVDHGEITVATPGLSATTQATRMT